MRITVDEITRIVRHCLRSTAAVREREAEARRVYRAVVSRIAAEDLVAAGDPAGPAGEAYPQLWRVRPGPPTTFLSRTLMERCYGEPEPDDVDRVQPSIRDQWNRHAAVSPTYDPTPRSEAAMTTDDILVAIDEALREYDDEAQANEQAQADKIAGRKDRRGETAAAGGASPSDILDRVAVPGGNWPTS